MIISGEPGISTGRPLLSKTCLRSEEDFGSWYVKPADWYAAHGVELCVPKTSSASCDQVIFVDQATDVSLPSDVVLLKVDRFG